MDYTEYIDEALENGNAYQSHFGGYVYCIIPENNSRVDTHQF